MPVSSSRSIASSGLPLPFQSEEQTKPARYPAAHARFSSASSFGACAWTGRAPTRSAAPRKKRRSGTIAKAMPLRLFRTIPPGAADNIRDPLGIFGPKAYEKRMPACIMRRLPKGVGIGFKQDFLFVGLAHHRKTARLASRRSKRLAVQLRTGRAVKREHFDVGQCASKCDHIVPVVERQRHVTAVAQSFNVPAVTSTSRPDGCMG